MRTGPLRPEHRAPLAALLNATGAFNAEEVRVALSLFDLSAPGWSAESPEAGDAPVDYEFVGAFDEGGALVGYASFGPAPGTEGTYDLYWLAVDPRAQGKGAGRALLGEVERILGDRAARMLVAETSGRPDYAGTRAFYLATGYLEAARVQDFYAPADDRIMLHRRITARERGVATR